MVGRPGNEASHTYSLQKRKDTWRLHDCRWEDSFGSWLCMSHRYTAAEMSDHMTAVATKSGTTKGIIYSLIPRSFPAPNSDHLQYIYILAYYKQSKTEVLGTRCQVTPRVNSCYGYLFLGLISPAPPTVLVHACTSWASSVSASPSSPRTCEPGSQDRSQYSCRWDAAEALKMVHVFGLHKCNTCNWDHNLLLPEFGCDYIVWFPDPFCMGGEGLGTKLVTL